MYVRVASRLTMAGLRIKSNPDNSFSWLPRLGNHGHLSLNLLSTGIYAILAIFPKKQILIFAMLVLRKKTKFGVPKRRPGGESPTSLLTERRTRLGTSNLVF